MFENETWDALISRWSCLTLAEKEAIQTQADQARERINVEARKHRSSKEFHLHMLEAGVLCSFEMAEGFAYEIEKPEMVYAIELEILNNVFSPEMLAWERACEYLYGAMNDPAVMLNSVVLSMLTETYTTALDADFTTKESSLLFGIERAIQAKISERARNTAKSKNAKYAAAREFVVTAYNRRVDIEQSKASFSREYAGHVKSRYKIIIGADTIARDWLPKSGKGALGVS